MSWDPTVVPSERPPLGDLLLLGVAVVAISTSAPLIRGADAPTLAIAAWRNLLSLPVLGLFVLLRRDLRGAWRSRSERDRRLSLVAGALSAALLVERSFATGEEITNQRGHFASFLCEAIRSRLNSERIPNFKRA